MSNAKIVSACLVIIGNEILSGRTQDANLNFLAKNLGEAGIQMREARVIPDVVETIVATINEVRAKYDYVFTTGGIGPTHDDITAECVAKAFGVKLVIDPDARRALEERLGKDKMNEARLRMAHVPEGAKLILNSLSVAPGFNIGNVYVMAGVPAVARAMFDWLRPQLAGGSKVLSRSIVCDLAEGTIAKDLGAIQDRFPGLDIGSYPAWTTDGFRVSLVLRGVEEAEVESAAQEVRAMIGALDGNIIDE